MIVERPDFQCLFQQASNHNGYFTTRDAAKCGYGTDLLSHQSKSGRFQRVHRGVYRIRDYPESEREDIVAAWLAVGEDRAVVSHESALRVHDLSDVFPYGIHVTVPRSIRNLPNLPGVRIHTTTRELKPEDTVLFEGMRLTSVPRTIVDCAQAGTGPEQIEMAVAQAIAEGITTPNRLRMAAADRSARVQQLIDRSIDGASE